MSISVCKFSYLHGNGRFLKSVFAPSLFSLPLVVGSCSLLLSFVRRQKRERERKETSAHIIINDDNKGNKKREKREADQKKKSFSLHTIQKNKSHRPSCCRWKLLRVQQRRFHLR